MKIKYLTSGRYCYAEYHKGCYLKPKAFLGPCWGSTRSTNCTLAFKPWMFMFNEQFIWESPKFTALNNFKYDRLHECYCWILEHGDEFTGLQWSLQISVTFGMWWNRRLALWPCSNCVMLSCQYGPETQKGFKHLVESKPWRFTVVLKA